jgi:sialate O-acetylesterase
MIAPVLKYPFKGVLWYQGESNDCAPGEYEKLFPLMIQDWRKNRGQENLPFIYVQLPLYGKPHDNREKDSWAVIRDAQSKAQSIPNCAMAAALDLGEWNDIHPLNKKDVGERLFLAACKLLFSAQNSSPGPVVRSFEKKENRLYIYFDNCANGLKADEEPFVSVFDGDEQKRLPCKIEKPGVISIDISSIKHPAKVFYAWANNPRDRQLFNSEGLPVIPFKIEL